MTAPEKSFLTSAAFVVFKYLLIGGIAAYCLHSCDHQIRIKIEVVEKTQVEEGK